MPAQLPIITCDDCGACCMHVGHPPFLPYGNDAAGFDTAYLDLPSHLIRELAEHRAGASYGNPAPCLWFDEETRRCKHYELRPKLCREFEVGSDGCRAVRPRRNHTPAAER